MRSDREESNERSTIPRLTSSLSISLMLVGWWREVGNVNEGCGGMGYHSITWLEIDDST